MTATRAIGIDFGTTNSVMALASDTHDARMIDYAAPSGATSVFRSALCFWQDEAFRGGLAHEAGPWAIAEYLDFPQGSRFCNRSNPWRPARRSNMPTCLKSVCGLRNWARFS
jgi:hypothetical chaperone protein